MHSMIIVIADELQSKVPYIHTGAFFILHNGFKNDISIYLWDSQTEIQ